MALHGSIWSQDYLEENPTAAFEAFRPQRLANFEGAPRTFFDYYQNRQGQLDREFQGALGTQARQGLPPTLTRVDFLSNFPWMQRFLALSPDQRGVQDSRFASRAIWNIPR